MWAATTCRPLQEQPLAFADKPQDRRIKAGEKMRRLLATASHKTRFGKTTAPISSHALLMTSLARQTHAAKSRGRRTRHTHVTSAHTQRQVSRLVATFKRPMAGSCSHGTLAPLSGRRTAGRRHARGGIFRSLRFLFAPSRNRMKLNSRFLSASRLFLSVFTDSRECS